MGDRDQLMESLARVLGAPLPLTEPPSGVNCDSRRVTPGDLFVAIPGHHVHGIAFELEAAAHGALAMVSDRPGSVLPTVVVPDPRAVLGPLAAILCRCPSERMDVVGVTGTNGKTTTAYLTHFLLNRSGLSTGRITTIDTAWGEQVRPSVRTTPEAPDLQAALARMLDDGCRAAVIEVSSHGLALGRVDGTRFEVGVFTNLGRDHYDFHGDREAYLACKASLFRDDRGRASVVNIDDPAGQRIVRLASCPVVTVSGAGCPDGDWRVTGTEQLGPGLMAFEASGPEAARSAPFSPSEAATTWTTLSLRWRPAISSGSTQRPRRKYSGCSPGSRAASRPSTPGRTSTPSWTSPTIRKLSPQRSPPPGRVGTGGCLWLSARPATGTRASVR